MAEKGKAVKVYKLARLVKLLTELKVTGVTADREASPPPAPEVKYLDRPIYIYVCTERGCGYQTRSKSGLGNHRRKHKVPK